MPDVLACRFSASNLTQGCQKIAVATWAFYHRLESNRSSTEIFCAAPRPIQRCLMVVHRSEEHTSELQSHSDLVCRLLLEKKKTHEPMQSCICSVPFNS